VYTQRNDPAAVRSIAFAISGPIACERRCWSSGRTEESERGLVLAPTDIRTSASSTAHRAGGETQSSCASEA
jgi:hypothetical protein